MIPRVVDLSHHNIVDDLGKTAAAGIWGVIHKATQGVAYEDPMYTSRRVLAAKAGLAWGAYLFLTNDNALKQATKFLNYARPDNDTLVAVDYEQWRLSQCTPQTLVAVLRIIEQKLGRKAKIYSGNVLKETLYDLSTDDRNYVQSHDLWLCQYGPSAVLPRGFAKYFLWQYTDGRVGPGPHTVSGLVGDPGVDLNAFSGTKDQLIEQWAGYEKPLVS